MIEKYIRPAYQIVLVNPVARRMGRFPAISANKVSVLSGVLGIFVLLAMGLHYTALAIAVLLFSGYLDTLDGTMARMRETTSAKGTVLDIFCDRIVEACVFIGLFLIQPDFTRGLLCLLMLMSSYLCITSFLVVGIFSKNTTEKSFYYSPGLIERAEAFIFFVLMILLPSQFVFFALLYTVCVLWTAFYRLVEFFCQF